MKIITNWKEDLFTEKSLLDVYKQGFRVVGSEGCRKIVTISGVFFTLLAAANIFCGPFVSVHAIALANWGWAETGVNLSASILGFLIAGFTIFATMAKPEFFKLLAHVYYQETKLSHLKFIFFNFIFIFIHYLVFLATALTITLLFKEGYPAWEIAKEIRPEYPLLVDGMVHLTMIVMGTYFIAAMLMLKSFLWNLYQSIILAIATQDEYKKWLIQLTPQETAGDKK